MAYKIKSKKRVYYKSQAFFDTDKACDYMAKNDKKKMFVTNSSSMIEVYTRERA